MVDEVKKCPKCGGEMEVGELRDNMFMNSVAQEWAPDASGYLSDDAGGIMIISFRCIDCGYLENYAHSDKRKKELKKKS